MSNVHRVGAVLIIITALGAGGAVGQEYPTKPIRIVTGNISGSTGLASRFVADGISGPLGQQVVVDSRGSGAILEEIVAQAPPDGYVLLVNGASFYTSPLTRKTSYDPVKDFSPITLVGESPNILVITPWLQVKSVKELIALAKARPGELNYSRGGIGGSSHLGAELFKYMAGVKIQGIGYSSGSVELTDLISGQVQMSINSAGAVLGQVKLGKLRALAVGSAQPSALAPGLPTISESALPGYDSVQRVIMSAPAKTPDAIIKRLNQETMRFLKTTKGKEQFFNAGIEVVASSPEQLAATVKTEMTRLSKVIKAAGISVD